MTQNDEFLYQLKIANPIETVFGSYVNLIRRGHNYVCSCPFHSEKTPSCTVYTDSQSFYCYGCGAGGDVINFIMRIENLDFSEAVKELASRAGLEVPSQNRDSGYAIRKKRIYEANREAANYFYLNLIKGTDKRGLKYFADRKLMPQTIKKYGLGYAADSWDNLFKHMKSKGFSDEELIDAWLCTRSEKTGKVYDIFRNRVIFPIIDLRGNIIGFGGRVLDDTKPKYLNTNKTPVFDKGNNLFSMNFAKNTASRRLILAEGYMDVIAMNQAGFDNAVATLGTAITSEQARLMHQYCNEVIICYDSDTAGQTASQKAINQLSAVGVSAKIIKMEGAKDPDEYIKKFGAVRFKMLLEGSSDANLFMLEKCREGLNMNSEQGKIEFTKRAVNFLAGIENTIDRDIYISRTAAESGISRDVLVSHIDAEILKKKRSDVKKEWRNTVTETYKKDNINPDASEHRRESRAEEFIILYLLKHQEDCENISQKAPESIFVTAFNKKAYSAVLHKLKEYEHFTLSMLAEEFSAEEMGRISGIEAKNREIDINTDVFEDCIALLKKYHSKSALNSGDNLNDNALSEIFKNARNKK